VSCGKGLTPQQALHRIKHWCILGNAIADGPGSRDQHMYSCGMPRFYKDEELKSLEELDAVAANLPP